MTLISMPPE